MPLKSKIETICKEIYRAGKVVYEPKALEQLETYEKMGFSDAYICMAKTPQSLTDDPKVLGAPRKASPSRSGKSISRRARTSSFRSPARS
jgi:formyltetrahydrofolate synthetase